MPKVRVVDYDPTWPETFAALQCTVTKALGPVALSVEHVGSTSVPGLAAKPIIDIDVVVGSRSDFPTAVASLAALGYTHRGNLGIEDRESFEHPSHLPLHNLYLCVQGSMALTNHLAIRDALRRSPDLATRYAELKRQLASQFPTDIDSYIAGKTDFLLAILRVGGFAETGLKAIRDANEAVRRIRQTNRQAQMCATDNGT